MCIIGDIQYNTWLFNLQKYNYTNFPDPRSIQFKPQILPLPGPSLPLPKYQPSPSQIIPPVPIQPPTPAIQPPTPAVKPDLIPTPTPTPSPSRVPIQHH